MFQLGASLTAARESRGLSLADAEKLTRLRLRYLAALEDERFEELPGRVYARAFLRTYADALGLDADMFVDEFELRYPEPEEEPLVFPARERRRFPVALLVGLAAVAAVIAAVAWNGSSHSRRLAPPTAALATPAPRLALPRTVSHTITFRKPKPPPLVVRAVGGRCWLLVRRGGASGPVLYEGTLEPGQAVRFASRVWIRLGAPYNVVVRRGAQTFASHSGAPLNLVA